MNVGVYIAEMFSTGNDAAKRAVIPDELDLRALGRRAEEDAHWRAARTHEACAAAEEAVRISEEISDELFGLQSGTVLGFSRSRPATWRPRIAACVHSRLG
jgi:hypothetical protein